jgi:outer membrane receptor protein involved in Fe transport
VEYGLSFIPGSQWHFRVGGAYALHKFEDFQLSTRPNDPVKKLDGFEMPSSPRLTSNAEVIYTPKWLGGLRLSAEWQYLSPWFINQINTFRYEDKGFLGFRGMSVLNARINYTWKGLELFASVLNATNELYAVSLGRGNGVNDRTNFQPGAPRTIGFGVQYNFTGKSKAL